MLINTAVWGPLDVTEDNIYHFSQGPFGFDESGDYAVIAKTDEDVTLRWLQAVNTTVPCFVVFNPFEIIEGYTPQLEKNDLQALGCENEDALLFLVIAVVPEDITKITVNLKSPIALNPKTKQGRQVILANKDYPIRFPLHVSE